MERLRHSDYARLLDFIAELHEPVSLPNFGRMIVRLTCRLVPGATIAFDQIDESKGLYRGFDHNAEISPEDQIKFECRLQELYRQNPIYSYIQSGGTERVVDLDDLMPKREFRRTDFYQDIFRPNGIRHQLCVLLSRKDWIITMTLNHSRPIPEKVKLMIALAERHIQLAHRNACSRETVSDPGTCELTPRESQVFHWLGRGKRNGEIALILGCSPRTVEKHVENILRKTGAETRTAAVFHGETPD
jgi:DNA-binding CsgD family transcriptional regulator